MLFVLITSAKVVQKAKTHYTINNICSTILINHKLFVHLLHEIRESPPQELTQVPFSKTECGVYFNINTDDYLCR